MKEKILIFLFFIFIVLNIGNVLAFTGESPSYTVDSKFDFGSANTNASSITYDQRLISGEQPVSQYTSYNYDGRFGILNVLTLSAINITSPLNNVEIIRGNDATLEDDLGLVSNTVNFLTKVYVNNTNSGIPNINVSFYWNGTLLSTNLTNSSGVAIYSYDKSSESVGIYSVTTNYSDSNYDYSIYNSSTINLSLVVYNIPREPGNKGVRDQYVDGQTAILYFNITKTNVSGTFFYGPKNINISAAESGQFGDHYPDSAYVSGYRVYNTTAGQYESHLVVNKSFDDSIRWEISISDDDFDNYLASTSHSDVGIVDGPLCGNGINETGEECDDGNLDAGDGCSVLCAIEDAVTPPGPSGDSCTDECIIDSVDSTCVTDGTLRTRTCGNYDLDSCLEWGNEIYQDCGPDKVCQDAKCIPTNCDNFWECGDWDVCINGEQTRTCVNDVCNLSSKTEVITCVPCQENWKCDWTTCSSEDELSYPYNCVDLNECGTNLDKPQNHMSCEEWSQIFEEDDGCSRNWECGEWGECETKYDIKNVLNEDIFAKGTSSRGCVDLNGCQENLIEEKSCELRIPIYAKEVQWCLEDYIEVYEIKTDKLVSRVREKEVVSFTDLNSVDISFIMTEFTGYCDYCFDGFKDHDETGVDCGGPSCPECVSRYSFFNWLYYVILFSWSIFGFLIIIFLWRIKKEKERYAEREGILPGIKSWFVGLLPDKRKDKIKGAKIARFFARLFRRKREAKRIEKEIRIREGTGERKPIFEWKRVISSEERMLVSLRAKLRKWRQEGYAGTASLEAKIASLKRRVAGKEKSFVKRIISGYRARRERKRIEKENVRREKELEWRRGERDNENERIRIESGRKREILEREHERRLEEARKKRDLKIEKEKSIKRERKIGRFFSGLFSFKKFKANRGEEKKVNREVKREEPKPIEHKFKKKSWIKKLFEEHKERKEKKKEGKKQRKIYREIIRNHKREEKIEKKKIKLEKKVRRKERKKKIRVLKGELRRAKLGNLMKKLKIWKKEGYYGTAKLETEIRKLKIQKD